MLQYIWSNADKTCFLIVDGNGHSVAVDAEHPLWGTIPESAILPFEEPTVSPPTIEDERLAMSMTFAQLLIGLVGEGWITKEEGIAWLAGTPPQPVNALIAQLPEQQQFQAFARAVRPSIVLRTDPLVVGLGGYTGKTPEQIDTFFRSYSVV